MGGGGDHHQHLIFYCWTYKIPHGGKVATSRSYLPGVDGSESEQPTLSTLPSSATLSSAGGLFLGPQPPPATAATAAVAGTTPGSQPFSSAQQVITWLEDVVRWLRRWW